METNTENMNKKKWGGLLNEILWTCAGVNKEVLRQCPSDYAKYAGSGGTILFTALMAMLSGGYAMYFVFNSTNVAIVFGIFWGLLIFNLDRYIVNTMYSDGLPTISWGEVRSGLPRIIIAIFLGIVISTPLEMKIFEDRINSQLVKDNIRRTNETRAEAEKGNTPLVERRNKLEDERKAISTRLAEANKELKEEGEGSALSGKMGHGPIYAEKEANRDAIQKELDDWDKEYMAELESIKSQLLENSTKIGADIENGNEENGFCVRYEAFSHVKDDNFALQLVSWVIMLLFIVIETAPTFFKMMMSSGPYDDRLRADMHRIRVLADKEISDVNDDVNTSVMISTEHNRNRLAAETLANKALLEQIAAAQADILSEAIKLWREDELEKVRRNPSLYIQSGNSSISDGPIIAEASRVVDSRMETLEENVVISDMPEEINIDGSNEVNQVDTSCSVSDMNIDGESSSSLNPNFENNSNDSQESEEVVAVSSEVHSNGHETTLTADSGDENSSNEDEDVPPTQNTLS